MVVDERWLTRRRRDVDREREVRCGPGLSAKQVQFSPPPHPYRSFGEARRTRNRADQYKLKIQLKLKFTLHISRLSPDPDDPSSLSPFS